MGFNIITSTTTLLFHNQTVQQADIRTPIMYIYAVLFSPVFEELLCRKILLIKINKYFNWWISAFISSGIFSILHLNLSLFTSYLFIGLVWSYYYRKSNYNIFVPILSHFLFNYIMILIQSIKG
ncbi:CPBP family intramembrane glutamic endopeptidase [Paenibacillus sophorae]